LCREKELVTRARSSIRKSFLKVVSRLSISLRSVAFPPVEKKRSLVMMLVAVALVASLIPALVTLESIIRPIVVGSGGTVNLPVGVGFGSGGTVNLPIGVGFYWDNNCTDPVSFIDWGTIWPGSTVNVTVFVKNEGSQAISLNITAENWTPIETASYMAFSSNYMGQTINLQENLQITLSLTTSPNIEEIASFSFDISVGINRV
jgi:hypothetical protein